MALRSVALSPLAQHLAVSDDSGSLLLWTLPPDAASSLLHLFSRPALPPPCTLLPPSSTSPSPPLVLRLRFDPFERSLASVGTDGLARLWSLSSLSSPSSSPSLPEEAAPSAPSPWSQRARVLDEGRREGGGGGGSWQWDAVWTADGRQLVTGGGAGSDGGLLVWETGGGLVVKRLLKGLALAGTTTALALWEREKRGMKAEEGEGQQKQELLSPHGNMIEGSESRPLPSSDPLERIVVKKVHVSLPSPAT